MSRASSRTVAGALPITATRFVGRHRELAEVRHLLGAARLVTLTGVGGVGKTRLALEVAQRVRRAYPGGVRFVDLATVTDAALVAPAVVTALGVRERSTRPPPDQLVDHLGARETLLVLDNCEHVQATVAGLVEGLLRRTEKVRVLATSRHVLAVPGERLYAVPPLAVPDPIAAPAAALVSRYDAVALLVDRVSALASGFAVTDANAGDVAALCARLDGLPLAIELAATRLRTLTPDQVLHRLQRRFTLLTGGSLTAQPRQQTLRSMVDWSHALCAPAERLLWSRLSVFAGSFDLAAVEGVCADHELPEETVADLLDRLVSQSIVVAEPDRTRTRIRFRLLETIRQYGRERLAEHGQENAMRLRHRDYYVDLAEQTAARWCGPNQAPDLARLRADHGNLQAALETALEPAHTRPGAPEPALRLVNALRYHWCADGYLGDGRRWLDRVLELPGPDDAWRAQALWVAAWVCLLQGDEAAAAERLAACRKLAEAIGDGRSIAFATSLCGTAALFRGELDLAAGRLDAAARTFAGQGDTDGLLWALFQLAITLSHLGEHDRATEICHRSLRISVEHGEQLLRSYALWVLGFDIWRRGDAAGATGRVAEGLALQRAFHDPVGAALMIELLAWIAASAGQIAVAETRLAAAGAVWVSIGTTIEAFGPPLAAHHHACVAQVRAGAGPAMAGAAAGRTTALGDILRQVLDGVNSPGTRAEGVRSDPAPRPRAAMRQPGPEQAPGLGPEPGLEPGPSVLSARELAVAELVAQGHTNRGIAAALVVSPRTVDGHMERILAKLGFSSRTQVAAWLTAHQHESGRPRGSSTLSSGTTAV